MNIDIGQRRWDSSPVLIPVFEMILHNFAQIPHALIFFQEIKDSVELVIGERNLLPPFSYARCSDRGCVGCSVVMRAVVLELVAAAFFVALLDFPSIVYYPQK